MWTWESEKEPRSKGKKEEKYRFFIKNLERRDRTNRNIGWYDCRLTVKQSVEGHTRLAALEQTTAQQLLTVVRGKQRRERSFKDHKAKRGRE